MIRQSVLDAYHQFSEPLEGRVHSMYLDILGLVTTGVGNLIDTPEQACQLPWRHEKTGRLAERHEIAQAWRELKSRKDLAKMHWKYAAALNDLRLSDDDIDAVVRDKLQSNARYLQHKYFARFADFPADAQLGILSMAWAVGPGFPLKFPNFANRVLANDWEGAVATCKIREDGNPGIVPRNKANRLCFGNAAVVAKHGLDPEMLSWPALLMEPVVITPGDEQPDTEPQV